MSPQFDVNAFEENVGCSPDSKEGGVLIQRLVETLTTFSQHEVGNFADLKALSHGVKGVAETAGLMKLARVSRSIYRYHFMVNPYYSSESLKNEIEQSIKVLSTKYSE